MEILHCVLPDSPVVVVNFPGRPDKEHAEDSHIGKDGKYVRLSYMINELGIGFIGFSQVHENKEIIPHTNMCLEILQHMKEIQGKIILIMGSSAGSGGIIASSHAHKIAAGMILFNTNPYNVGLNWVEEGFKTFPRWIDCYSGFQETPGHANWVEGVVKDIDESDRVVHDRIQGMHSLTAAEIMTGVRKTLQRRGIVIE